MSVRRIRIRPIPSAVVLAMLAACGSVRAVPIYGGPEYNSVTQTGYQSIAVSYVPASGTGNGMAAGYGRLYESGINKGYRAVRWDVSGADPVELGHLGLDNSGRTDSRALAINHAGATVGYVSKFELGIDKGIRAVRWDASGTIATVLDHLGTDNYGRTSSIAYAINNAGTAVGLATKFESGIDKGSRAVRWDASGTTATELAHLGSDNNDWEHTRAYAINASGTIVGIAYRRTRYDTDDQRVVRWDASGTVATELGHLGLNGNTNNTVCFVFDINDAGTAVGQANKLHSGFEGLRAVRWDASGTDATELGHIGLDLNGRTTSEARAINNAGTAVGIAHKHESGNFKGIRAVRWDASGTAATELGHIGTNNGYTTSEARAINAAGIAVGVAGKYDHSGTYLGSRAVAWGSDSVAVDLSTLLEPGTSWVNLSSASGISDTYWIAGSGLFDPDGSGPLTAYYRAFLLDAISLFGTPGDATRDGLVNFDDLLLVAQHYGTTAGGKWDTGDFNGDGAVDFDDLLALAQHYGTGGPSLAEAAGVELTDAFQADWSLAQSLVPEPASLSLLAFAGLALRRRRG